MGGIGSKMSNTRAVVSNVSVFFGIAVKIGCDFIESGVLYVFGV